jgi:hypothetical protein
LEDAVDVDLKELHRTERPVLHMTCTQAWDELLMTVVAAGS